MAPADFLRRVYELTPRTWMTPALIAANVVVFLFAATQGAAVFSPSVASLLALGGDNATLVAQGQWWRLFTSMFLHAGLVHIGMNMYVLSSGGRLVERLFGPVPFLVLYLLSGLVGSVTSLVVHPDVSVGVGASGAIFGVFGGLGGYLVAQRRWVPPAVLGSMRRALGEFVVLNLVIGLAVPFVDLSAHAGGLAGGALFGALLARPPTLDGVRSRLPRAIAVAVVGLVVVAAAAWLLVVRGEPLAEILALYKHRAPGLSPAPDSIPSSQAVLPSPRPMRVARALSFWLLFVSASCGGAEVRPATPCMSDSECHGDRICHEGRCRFPEEVRHQLGLGDGVDAGDTATHATPDAGARTAPLAGSPTFMGDARHTGRVAHALPTSEPHVAWQVATSGRMPASPVIAADGTIVVGSLDHTLLAVAPAGTVRFRYTSPERVRTTALVAPDGGVVLGADDGSVIALASDGTLRWRAQLHGAIGFGLARDEDGTVYVPSDGLYALDAGGNVRWRVATAGLVTSPPAVHPQGLVLFGTTDGKLVAVRRDGSTAWELATGGAIEGGATVMDDGTIVVGNDCGTVVAADAQGHEKWRFACGADVRATPAVGRDGTIYVGSYDQKLHALDATGHEKWQLATHGRIRSSVRVDPDGRIVFGSQDDGLYAVTPDGQLLWRVNIGSDVDSTPAVGADGTIYVGADDGALRALR